ncbi:MAG: class I SAM-dependent methyltransferase [Phascolarctobacterium sp.]|nr:class I SAM-dependent methyltransferase [Phascolarctobacterium sp.]
MKDKTLEYYNEQHKNFVEDTLNVDFKDTQEKFLNMLPEKAHILDFGCGSGRDTKYFLERGFKVTAIDGSLELCKFASMFTGVEVKHMFFQDLSEVNVYNGIWACSSILHLPWEELKDVMNKMVLATKKNGIIYTSFKYGMYEGERKGRYFTDMTEEKFKLFLREVPGLKLKELWVNADVRAERRDEKWLNLILTKEA